MDQRHQQPVDEAQPLLRAIPGLTQAGTLATFVPSGLAPRPEFGGQFTEVWARDAAEGRMRHGRTGLIGHHNPENSCRLRHFPTRDGDHQSQVSPLGSAAFAGVAAGPAQRARVDGGRGRGGLWVRFAVCVVYSGDGHEYQD